MKHLIIPSIIAKNQAELATRVAKIKSLKPSFLQLDVMDGNFVKNTSFEFDFTLPKNMKTEAHLMVEHPDGWLNHNHSKISSAVAHYKADTHMHLFIEKCRLIKKKVGIAINPEVPVEAIAQYLNKIDKVLVMAVHPGKYGARFLPEVIGKIKHLRELAPKLDIEVDGGITPDTLARCKQAGANQFVVGSYLQNAKDVKMAWRELGASINNP